MPSVREWATSLKSSSRDSLTSRRRSSLLDSSIRRVSESSLSNMDINDSERTLVGTLEVEDLQQHYSADQQRRTSSVSSSVSQDQQSKDTGSIERRVDYFVVEDDRYAVRFGNYTGVWSGNTSGSVPQTRSRYFGDHIHQHAYNTNKT